MQNVKRVTAPLPRKRTHKYRTLLGVYFWLLASLPVFSEDYEISLIAWTLIAVILKWEELPNHMFQFYSHCHLMKLLGANKMDSFAVFILYILQIHLRCTNSFFSVLTLLTPEFFFRYFFLFLTSSLLLHKSQILLWHFIKILFLFVYFPGAITPSSMARILTFIIMTPKSVPSA